MRSRYTAFARGDARYLMSTWHPGTAPAELSLDDATQWLGLEILDAPPVADDAKRGVVEFVARYRESTGTRGRIHERSRFVRQSGRWWYLDGVHS
jgi:SEC-C motif domain protein